MNFLSDHQFYLILILFIWYWHGDQTFWINQYLDRIPRVIIVMYSLGLDISHYLGKEIFLFSFVPWSHSANKRFLYLKK